MPRSLRPSPPKPLAPKPATKPTEVFERMAVLADPVRCRLLGLLERDELSVSELCTVMQLPQSTISRHLKTLSDDGWLQARKDGTSRRYSTIANRPGEVARSLWSLLRDEITQTPASQQDRLRLDSVLAERRTRSQEFFSSEAERWVELRRELFGDRFDLLALLGLLDGAWTVGDLGCGSGQLAAALAPFVSRVIAIDESSAMLDTARERLRPLANVEVRPGRLECLPVADQSLDAATLMLVLHHVTQPAEAIREVARALRPGGKLLLVDMTPHEHEKYRQTMGHIWLGFSERTLQQWLAKAGFEKVVHRTLPATPQAKGPTLFAVSASRALTTEQLSQAHSPAEAGDRHPVEGLLKPKVKKDPRDVS